MSSYGQDRGFNLRPPLPSTALAEVIADNVSMRKKTLAGVDEHGAILTAAQMLAVVHEEYYGGTSAAAHGCDTRYIRQQHHGTSALSLEDFVDRLLRNPAARRCLDILLERFGEVRAPTDASPEVESVAREMADLVHRFNDLSSAWVEDLADNQMDDAERILELGIAVRQQAQELIESARIATSVEGI